MITLPWHPLPLPLCINLKLVECLEKTGGSLFKTADMLVENELPVGDVLKLLATAYRHAGADASDEILAEFILQQVEKPPALLLSDILVAILSPMGRVGAVDVSGDGTKKA